MNKVLTLIIFVYFNEFRKPNFYFLCRKCGGTTLDTIQNEKHAQNHDVVNVMKHFQDMKMSANMCECTLHELFKKWSGMFCGEILVSVEDM